jgi:hypothetical protein
MSQASNKNEAQISRKKAQDLILGNTTNSQARSQAERNLLLKAHTEERNSHIEGLLEKEERGASQDQDELVQKILFWQKPKVEGDIIDPIEEKKKLSKKTP